MTFVLAMMLAATQAGAASPMAAGAAAVAACSAVPVAPPPELAGWTRMVPAEAGASAGAAAPLTIGTAVRARLLPDAKIAYLVRPGKLDAASNIGGLFTFVAPAAGRYRVVLGSGVWVDMIQQGRALVSVAHGHGPECSGVRKTVDFDLAAGPALLQIAGSTAQRVELMVVRLP